MAGLGHKGNSYENGNRDIKHPAREEVGDYYGCSGVVLSIFTQHTLSNVIIRLLYIVLLRSARLPTRCCDMHVQYFPFSLPCNENYYSSTAILSIYLSLRGLMLLGSRGCPK